MLNDGSPQVDITTDLGFLASVQLMRLLKHQLLGSQKRHRLRFWSPTNLSVMRFNQKHACQRTEDVETNIKGGQHHCTANYIIGSQVFEPQKAETLRFRGPGTFTVILLSHKCLLAPNKIVQLRLLGSR